MTIPNMRFPAVITALLLLPLSGCVVFEDPIPTHCADKGGNDACAEGAYCSTCRIAGGGCVPELPSLSCRVPGDYDGGSSTGADGLDTTGTSDGTFDSESSDGGPISATGSGGSTDDTGTDDTDTEDGECWHDDECTIERPFCEDGECVRCDEAGEGACERLSPAAPVCIPGGWCAECSPTHPDSCGGATPVCENYQCVPCTSDDQCADGVCDLASGECSA